MTTTRIPVWTLGERLAKARREAGLEQADMAKEIGLSRVTIGNYETGTTNPQKPTVLLWAAITGVDAGWLLTGSDHGDRRSACTSDAPAQPLMLAAA